MNEEEKPLLRFARVGIEPPFEQGEPPVSLIAVHSSTCQRDDCEILNRPLWSPRGVWYRSAQYRFLVTQCGWGVVVFDSVGRFTARLFGEFLAEELVPGNEARGILWEQRRKLDILNRLEPVRIGVQSEYCRCFLRRELVTTAP
jgi:hypothetical protein